MKNPRYQYTFRYIGTLLYSLFVGFLVSYAIAIMSGALLYSPSHFKGSYFDFPELLNAFVIASGFFLGGILAPWLISLFFGTVDKRIVFASYFFTTFLTIIYVILLATGKDVGGGFGNFWALTFAIVSALSIVPLCILSHLSLIHI